MKKITKLTPEQEAAMKLYADKWIEIGLRTGETDFETFDKYMPICYQKAGIPYPTRIVRVKSPLVGALAASVAEAIWRKLRVDDAVDGAVGGAVRDAVDGAVGGAVRDAVDDAVDDAVGDAVRDAVDDAVRDAVGDAVRDAVRDAVDGAVDDAVDDAVKTAVSIAKRAGVALSWHYWLGGQFWVGGWYYWGITFANFFFDICKLKLSQDIMDRALAYRKVCESVNYIWPNRDFVMVCERPAKISRDDRGRLHCPDGKAIEYPDGWGLYYLHGVRVPEKLIITPADQLQPNEWINHDNAEVRAQFVRKFGVEHLKSYGTTVDVSEDYELIDLIKLFPRRNSYTPYLFMKNPSTGTIHAEGVSEQCHTVIEALAWRDGEIEYINPDVLT